MNILQFRPASKRNTKSSFLVINEYKFLISYTTIVAVRGPDTQARLADEWGPTTRKHLQETYMYKFPIISTEEMENILHRAIVEAAQRLVVEKFE